jgi:hypothetical protein
MQMYKISHIREQSCKTVQLPQGMTQQLTNLDNTSQKDRRQQQQQQKL